MRYVVGSNPPSRVIDFFRAAFLLSSVFSSCFALVFSSQRLAPIIYWREGLRYVIGSNPPSRVIDFFRAAFLLSSVFSSCFALVFSSQRLAPIIYWREGLRYVIGSNPPSRVIDFFRAALLWFFSALGSGVECDIELGVCGYDPIRFRSSSIAFAFAA